MRPPFDPLRTCTAMVEVTRGATARPAELALMRATRLAALLDSARRSALYGAIIGERDPSTLRLADLPIMRKAELMQRFNEWVTGPALGVDGLKAFMADPANIGDAYLGRFMAWESSGSQGAPGIFVQDAASLAVYDALEYQRRCPPRPMQQALDPWGLGEHKVFIGATDGHFASTCSIERLRRLNPFMATTLHSLSFMMPLEALIDELNTMKPAVIATYPSVAVMLAEERLAGCLSIAPREIWTGGETLTDGMRALIKRAFGCPVINSYGASEFMSLASECAHGKLHLNSDWAILEPVDEAGNPPPPGRPGTTTLLTNLANHVQPIIRYDLGDRVLIHEEPCTCGSRLPVISVEGRSGDVVHLRHGASRGVKISSLAFVSVLEAVNGLTDFQLIQTATDKLELRTALPMPAASTVLQAASSALHAFLRGQAAGAVDIECQAGKPSRRTRDGKAQRVIALPAKETKRADQGPTSPSTRRRRHM